MLVYVCCFGLGFIPVISGRDLRFSKAAPFLQHVLLLLTVLFSLQREERKERRRGREGERKGKKEMPSDMDPLGWPGTSTQWLQSVNAFCFKRIDMHRTCPNSVCALESRLVEPTHVGIGLESQ